MARPALVTVLFLAAVLSACAAETPSAPAQGPRMTDAEFFAALNLDYPGLEETKSAVRSGDLAAAKHEFAEHIRHRTKPVWTFDPYSRPKHDSRPDGVNTDAADSVLRHEITFNHFTKQFGDEIDWTCDPMNFNEWTHQLNRHVYWGWLGKAYWDTGDEKYAREWVSEMTSWVRLCPVPTATSGNETVNWRTIEAGIRTGQSWPSSFYQFLSSPSFTDDAIIMMVKSFAEHARQLMRWPQTGNWLAMETNGLLHTGVLFPEFKEAESWRRTSCERLYAELDKQVYPDGMQVELSTGYHQVSLSNFAEAYKYALLNDVKLPDDFVSKLRKMYEYDALASMPGGSLPGLNDACTTDIRWIARDVPVLYPDRKDLLWVATQGQQGEMPKVGSVAFPYCGHLVMRTGWSPDSLYMLFDAGPFGYGHQHDDALSLVLCAYGKYLLVDAGNHAYDTSQWRQYVRTTRAHNTVMVDGQQQRRAGKPRASYIIAKPLPNRWATTSAFDYAQGRYADGYGPKNEVKVAHTRSVFFAKPDYWIVTDFLDPRDSRSHQYETMFHLDSDRLSISRAAGCAVTSTPDSANLSIFSPPDAAGQMQVIKGQENPFVQGWTALDMDRMRPVSTLIFNKIASGPSSACYVLYPTPKGAACSVTYVSSLDVTTDQGARAAGIAIHYADGHTDYFAQSSKPGARLTFLGYETDAEAVLIKTGLDGQSTAYMAGGTRLTRNESTIQAITATVRDLSHVGE